LSSEQTIEDFVDCLKIVHPHFNFSFLFDHSQGHAKKLSNGRLSHHAELSGEGVEYSWGRVVKGMYRQKPLISKKSKAMFTKLVNDATNREGLITKTVRKLAR
jgi:hypothetical protein